MWIWLNLRVDLQLYKLTRQGRSLADYSIQFLCRFWLQTLTIMAFWMKVPAFFSFLSRFELSINVVLCLPLSFLPSNFSVSSWCSKPFLRQKYLKNLCCLFLIVSISDLLLFAFGWVYSADNQPEKESGKLFFVKALYMYTVQYNACQRYLEHQTRFKIFLLLPLFSVTNGSINPIPQSYNVESIVETFSFAKRHHFYLQVYSYLLHTTLF